MASRVEPFAVTVLAGTAIAAPLVTALIFDVGVVERVEFVVPPGASGQAGFALMHGGASVFPREEGRWIVADGEVIRWDTQDLPTAGDWALRQYNLGVFDHTVYVRFLVHEIGAGAVAPMAPLVVAQPNQPTVAPEDDLSTVEVEP